MHYEPAGLTSGTARLPFSRMRKSKRKNRRIYQAAIMLIATLGIVMHGAVILKMNPLFAAAAAQAAQTVENVEHAHLHYGDVAPAHISHHPSKAPTGGHQCCSSVSAATLPSLPASQSIVSRAGRFAPLRDISGNGLAPAEPAEPPRPIYQC